MAENKLIRAGIDSYLLYGEETTFGTKSPAVNKIPGIVTSFTPQGTRNLQAIRGAIAVLPEANDEVTARDAISQKRGLFEASCSVEFRPQNWRFMKYVLGSESGAGTGQDPYQYPQEDAETLADKKKYLRLPSITISSNMLFDGTADAQDVALNLLGTKIDSCTIRAAVGEPVNVSWNTISTDMSTGSTETGVALDSEDVYHFTGSSVIIDGDTVENIIDNFTLTINNGVTRKHGLGDDRAKALPTGERQFQLQVQMTAENITMLKAMRGGTTHGKPTLFDDGKLQFVGDNGRQFDIHLKNVRVNSTEFSGSYPNPTDENVNFTVDLIYCEEVV
jgi:hypothetical protein